MDSVERVIIDCRRLLCPLRVIRVQDPVKEMPPGTLVEAVCTDPGALQDIPAWRRLDGHRVVETGSEEANYLIRFRVTDCESEP